MNSLDRLCVAALLSAAGLCVTASAQPRLTITSMGSDLAASGQGVAGLAYDADLNEYVPMTWSRTAGFAIIPGAYVQSSGATLVNCSADLSALCMAADNVANWGDLNCFHGYYWSTQDALDGHTLGTARPPWSPCPMPFISHHWTQASGWVNTGHFPRFLDDATGRWYGGTRCDSTVNEPTDLSGSGRFLIANGYIAGLTGPNGPGFGLCGNFLPFRYDSVTGAIEPLPVQPGTTTARADRINFDGSTATGYDLGLIFNPDNTVDRIRRTCVWRNGVQYLLDTNFGAKDNAAVNGPGTMVATGASTAFVAANFPGQSGVRLVRWTFNGSAWTPTNLGKPAAYLDPNSGVPIAFSDLRASGISDDGNTIVGIAIYGAPPPTLGGLFRPFIWRPTINGGVPMDLEAYLRTIDSPTDPILVPGLEIESCRGVSADGNTLLVTAFDGRNTCGPWNTSHVTWLNGLLDLNGAAVACTAPQIGMHPKDWVERNEYSFGSAMNVIVAGTWPLNFQWQREDPFNPGSWVDLTESCADFNQFVPWAYEGVYKSQLRVSQQNGGQDRGGRYRVVVTNACGSVTSNPATLTFVQACNLADITDVGDSGTGADGQLTLDDILLFINEYNDAAGCPGAAPCNKSDITDVGDSGAGPDGQLSLDDILAFINAYNEGC